MNIEEQITKTTETVVATEETKHVEAPKQDTIVEEKVTPETNHSHLITSEKKPSLPKAVEEVHHTNEASARKQSNISKHSNIDSKINTSHETTEDKVHDKSEDKIETKENGHSTDHKESKSHEKVETKDNSKSASKVKETKANGKSSKKEAQKSASKSLKKTEEEDEVKIVKETRSKAKKQTSKSKEPPKPLAKKDRTIDNEEYLKYADILNKKHARAPKSNSKENKNKEETEHKEEKKDKHTFPIEHEKKEVAHTENNNN